MKKNTLLEKCSLTLIFSSKQVHEQQCLKVTQRSMVTSLCYSSWWVAPLISTHLLIHCR